MVYVGRNRRVARRAKKVVRRRATKGKGGVVRRVKYVRRLRRGRKLGKTTKLRGDPTGNTMSMFLHKRYTKPLNKIYKKIGRPIVDMYEKKISAIADANRQGAIDWNICPKNELQVAMQNTNLVLATPSATQLPASEFFLESIEGKLNITNPTNLPVRVDIYDIMSSFMSCTSSNYSFYSPLTCWANGLSNQGLIGTNTQIETRLGSKPYDSDIFNTYYKVRKFTSIIIPFGRTHVHRFNFKINQLMKNVYLNNLFNNVPNITYNPMIVFQGLPGSVSNGTTAYYGITQSALETEVQYSIRYSGIANNTVYTNNYVNVSNYTNSAQFNIANGSIETFRNFAPVSDNGTFTGYTNVSLKNPAVNMAESLSIVAEDIQKLVDVQGRIPAVVVDGSGNSYVNPATGLPWDATV